jgi:ABC-type glycerol-3-phosphate transport system permease component
MIVARTFIRSSIPKELLEASIMDGCSDFKYFIRMVIPLSKAIIAVNALIYFVGQWNSYMKPMMYLNERAKFTLPIFLKEILIASKVEATDMTDIAAYAALNERVAAMKYSVIVITMIPILCLYPFIQKYFVKGVMVGSVKG